MYTECFKAQLERLNDAYDEQAGMPAAEQGAPQGYHTRLKGRVHPTLSAAHYADAVFYLKEKSLYPRAERALRRLVELQDKREGKRTHGLWAYYAEEPLDQMLAPDFNWADFIGRHIAFILKKRRGELDGSLAQDLTEALARAAGCSIRRNVGADYTNIAMMSSNTVVAAAELVGDVEMLAHGRERLRHFLEYNRYNGVFTEYNSPTYTPLAIEEITRMMLLFEDEECLALARELNDIGWRMLATHFTAQSGQLMPPHTRAYHELTPPSVLSLIYLGTHGKYGALRHEDVSMTRLPYDCPEKYWHFFEPISRAREIREPYYRKNTIRRPEEGATIVRNLDSPDLFAYSYATPAYSMGVFRASDTWVQRRNGMVVFGDENAPTVLRLRCLRQNAEDQAYPLYDTCMGFVTADMQEGVMLGQCSLTVDHGDFHYILDKVKNGIYTLESLAFCFCLSGNTEGVSVEKTEHGWRFAKGDATVDIAVYGARFDGCPTRAVWEEEKKMLSIPLFSGEARTVSLPSLSDTVLTFTLSVNTACDAPVLREENGVRCAALGKMRVASYLCPVPYDTAVALAAEEQ